MRKLLLFFFALLTSVSGAWADDITVYLVDGKTNGTAHNPIGTLMAQDRTTLTSKADAGLAGVVLSNVANSGQGTWKVNNVDQRQFTIKPSAGKTAEKITITAPQGYIITGYSISCCNFSTSCTYKIDKSDTYNASTATSISNYSTYTTIDATFPSLPLTASTTNTASFWIYANAETASVNWLMINEFKVTLKQVITPPTSLTSGWYQLKWVDTAGASDYENADVNGKYVFNYATDVTVSSNDYALYLGSDVPSTLSEHATTLVYLTKNQVEGSYGISGNLQSANGRYISRSGASSLTAPSDKNYIIFFSSSSYPVNSVITSATSGNDRISLVPQGKNATPYIGQTNAADKYPMVQFCPVNLSEYNIQAWTVSILDPAGTHGAENTQVTYTGSNLYGLNKVYHNGTFFIASGTTPSATDFTAPVKDGVTPAISVDATNHIITVQYSVNVTYKMMFNGSEIKSVVVGENIGATASTPSAWTTPAFSSFTCPSTEITAETSEIEVTLSWDGPFEFSTDYASAKWYYMAFNGGYLIYDETPPYGFSTREDAIAAGEDAIWAFIGDPYNGVRVINKTAGNGKYLNLSSTVQMAEGTYPRYSLCGITENSTSETIGFSLDNDDYYYLCYHVPEEGDPYLWYGTGKAWAATSKGRITVEPYIVTYNLKFGGSTIATKTVDKVTGDSEELFPSEWARDFCTYSYEPAEIGNSTTSVDVTMTWNGPFDISADYENAVWYYLAVNGKWSKQVAFEAPNIYDDISEVKGLDVGEWAFYGNPYDGFLLSPKAKYSTYQIYLSSAAETPAFTLATESTEKWVAKKISGSTFTLNCGDKYLVDNSTTMGFKTTALEGSEGTFSVRSYYCQKGLDDFADYVGESTDKYFGVKPTSVTSVNSMIENMPKMTEAQYTENFTDLYNSLKSYIIFNWPETGYYRIKNNNYGDYIGYGKPEGKTGGQPEKTAGLVAIPSSNKATDYSTVIRLTKVSASLNTGVYTIATQGLNVQGTPSANAVYTASGSDDPVQFKFVVDGTPGIVYIKDSNASGSGDATEGCFHEANWSESHTLNGIVPYIHGAAPSKWVAEDVDEISIALNGPVGGYRYATLCVPFDVTLDAEAAYTLSLNANKDALTLSSASNEIAAGTPVLLRDESSSLTATIGTGYAAAPLTSTSLTGVYVDTQVSGTNYFLGVNSSDEIGFYHWGTGTKTLDANRAYFEASKLSYAVKGLSLIWDEETGINSIENGKLKIENEAVYDLSGRRVAKPTKGLYIKNGKKTVIK